MSTKEHKPIKNQISQKEKVDEKTDVSDVQEGKSIFDNLWGALKQFFTVIDVPDSEHHHQVPLQLPAVEPAHTSAFQTISEFFDGLFGKFKEAPAEPSEKVLTVEE